MENLLTLAEVAEITRTSPDTLRWWRHTGAGPKSWKLGRRVMYDRVEVERWLDEQRQATNGRGDAA